MPQNAADIYNTALAQATQMYNATNAGYAQVMATQRADAANVTAGYNRLLGSVLGRLTDADAAERQRLQDTYTMASGREAQDLTNRGLGNTTVSSSVQRGLLADYAKGGVDIGAQFGQLKASYESQLGLAGLNWQGQAAQQYAALGSQQLQTAAGFAPTFAGLYSGAAGLAQRQQEFEQNRSLQTYGMIAGMTGQAGAQTAQNAARNQAMGLQRDQLGFKYTALGAEQQQAGARNDLAYAQLGQQQGQFDATMNYNYDRASGQYGAGTPSAYAGRLPYAPRATR